jgi:hypothetical protein
MILGMVVLTDFFGKGFEFGRPLPPSRALANGQDIENMCFCETNRIGFDGK